MRYPGYSQETVEEFKRKVAEAERTKDVKTILKLRDEHQEMKRVLDRDYASMVALREWLIGVIERVEEGSRPSLQKNPCSRFHRVLDASIEGRVCFYSQDARDITLRDKEFLAQWSLAQPFVIRHDWSSVLNHPTEDMEIRLPYPHSVFEFLIEGKPVICLAKQKDGESPLFVLLFESQSVWWASYERGFTEEKDGELSNFILSHVRAICIALDAEVAVSEVVRAPEALNKKRAKRGKALLRGHRVVDLARRRRVANPLPPGDEPNRRVRLHFRRGHWRHYQHFKTWIRWTLVGDPDLGFVDKEYSL